MPRRPSDESRLRRTVVVFAGGLAAGLGALAFSAVPASAALARSAAPVNYPWSSLDSVAVWGNTMVAGGWSWDPDTRGTIKILAAVDAVGTKLAISTTGGPRPDVAPVAGGRTNTGFGVAVGGLAPGPHLMCIAAQNVGAGQPWWLFGCRNFTVPEVNPIGHLDVVQSQGNRAVVAGWTADPQTPIPNQVRIDVDGKPATTVRAEAVRNDVATLFPALGNLHGFSVTVPISPGQHIVCATGLNLDAGVDVSVGCLFVLGFAVDPLGSFDSASVVGQQIIVNGWGYDPDAAGASSILATDRESPLIDPTSASGVASQPRADVAAALGIDPDHGFSFGVTPTDPGPNTVCLAVVNRGYGADRSLGCRTVDVDDRRPQGQLTSVTPTAGGKGATVKGSVSDPDAPTAAVPLHVVVDGSPFSSTTANGQFSIGLPGLSPGSHSICVTAVDLAGSAPGIAGDRALPCGGVSLATASGAVSIGTTGSPSVSGPVAPASTSPIAGVDRDAGISVTLHDGSTLWLFGDSFEHDPAGNLKYFVQGTAAWTSAAQPRTTTDAVQNGAPIKFGTPISWGAPCPSDSPTPVMWPMSATVQFQTPTVDRVIVFMEDVCLGSGNTGVSRGLAVVDWTYDSTHPPANQPIVAHVLNQQIRATRTYGVSSVIAADGFLYASTCDGPIDGGWLTDYGPCHTSRVDPDQVDDTSAYQYWTGTTWSSEIGQVGDINLPDMIDETGSQIPVYPVASYTTRYDAASGLYVMAYSPWPGFTDQIVVRIGTSPVGPWTAPVQVHLPGCHDSVEGTAYHCYAGTAQPQFSVGNLLGSSNLGIGWYDQLTGLAPLHGAYEVGTVPFSVVKNP
jgi:hypothetical protein